MLEAMTPYAPLNLHIIPVTHPEPPTFVFMSTVVNMLTTITY